MSEDEKALFKDAIVKINDAYAAHKASGSADRPKWPATLRIKDIEGAPGVWEMTWSFSGPDGRATFEYFDAEGESAIRWRRIGNHRIFTSP